MTLDTALTTSNVDPEIAAAMAVFGRLQPLKDALGLGDLTEPEMHLFAMVAHHTGLDPFTKQIYAIKRGGRVTHQTGIDGYRTVAEGKGAGQYAGSDEATYEDCGCGNADSPAEHPKIARVVIHRLLPSGHMVNQTGVARWHELKPDHFKPQGARDFLDAMWWDMPYNQLAKCAEANGLRKAFPRVLGGIYIADEMQQADVIEGTARPVAPTASERIAARRAAVDPQKAAEPEMVDSTATEVTQPATAVCGDEDASPMMLGFCAEPPDHKTAHRNKDGDTWPRPR